MFEVDSVRIRTLFVNHGTTLEKLQKEIGLSAGTLKRLVSDNPTASLKVLGKVAKFFEVDINELIKK